ncbi:MAG TPA: hypothetical protein PLX97_08175, partial [Gemmatales bacterium]|nr:hypothetical protein [Gemmatales bacterium]
LSRTVWDPHDVKVVTKTTSHFGEVVDFDRDYEKETVLPGPYREMPGKDHVSGFVSPKKVMEGGKTVQKGYDAAKTYGPDDQGSIHLHFALCESIATTAIAYLIIHEASHKFAGTHDKAYADGLGNDVKYESLSIQDKSINADCYGYFCTSMMLGSMVRGKRDLYSSTRPEPPG